MGDESKFGTKILNAIKSGAKSLSINGISSGSGDKIGYRADQSKAENKDVTKIFFGDGYGIEQRTDTGDINNNTINDILSNVFSGNLFDAGISAITTSNIHSSWQLATRPIVDENKYNFLYNLDISNKQIDAASGGENKNSNEADVTSYGGKLHEFLDSMEDPTILGYSLMIDKDNSILFDKDTVLFNTVKNNQNANETSVGNSVFDPNKLDVGVPEKTTIDDVLKSYLIKYYNNTAVSFLENFRKDIMRVFITPSRTTDLYKGGLRNHYVKSITGLDKLDKMFVTYGGDKPECLELNLYEDVRLFTTNLKYMYNNFVYNYNQGIRVVPENLLKFNMFVKISEKRTFTLHNASDTEINKHAPTLIYQLHGCEFIFDESIVGSSVTMMGSESNDTYAGLKIKISYKKVTRIFDKPYGYSNTEDWIIDDTYNDLTTVGTGEKHSRNANIISGLQLNGSRSSLSNEIEASNNSLKSKISKFTNGGVLNTNGKTTLAGKFASSLGNNAIKAGSQFVEEEAKKAKNAIQTNIATSIDRNPILSSISNNVKNLLKSNIIVSTKDLGTLLPTDSILDQNGFAGISNDLKGIGDGNIMQNKSEAPSFLTKNNNTITKDDIPMLKYLNKDLDNSMSLYADMVKKYLASKEDIVPDGKNTNVLPDENLNSTTFKPDVYTVEDIVPDGVSTNVLPDMNLSNGIKNPNILPNEDLSNTTFKPGGYIVEDIVPDGKNTNVLPNEDLNNGIKNINTLPNIDLSNGIKNPNVFVVEDIVPDGINNNILPNENLNTGKINENKFTINSIIPAIKYNPILPKQDLSK